MKQIICCSILLSSVYCKFDCNVDCVSVVCQGLPDAFISIGTVHALTAQLTNVSEHVRGYAAIALGYLSYTPIAKRQILNVLV
jgi:hypothetical protein